LISMVSAQMTAKYNQLFLRWYPSCLSFACATSACKSFILLLNKIPISLVLPLKTQPNSTHRFRERKWPHKMISWVRLPFYTFWLIVGSTGVILLLLHPLETSWAAFSISVRFIFACHPVS
jgi:hypothetical protein